IRLGEVLLRVLDASQPAFRFGGEEFVVILPDMNCRDALQVADRIQRNLRDEVFSPAADVRITVTVSIGIAELRRPNDSAESLFRRADEAMYKAKADGRNRAVCF
ncbi:MAG: GGDEF domain-containing protein, partial [Bacillota bacterium]